MNINLQNIFYKAPQTKQSMQATTFCDESCQNKYFRTEVVSYILLFRNNFNKISHMQSNK